MRRCAGFLMIAVALLGAPAAHASMTLDGVTVDTSNLHGPGAWNVPDGGGTVTWTAPDWTGTYTFSVPGSIPDSGTSFPISVKAEARKNSFDQHTRFVPALIVTGGPVRPNGRVDVFADASSDTKPTDERSATVQLVPSGGTTVTVAVQDGPTYTLRYRVDAPPAPVPPPQQPGRFDVLRPPGVFCAGAAATVARAAQAPLPCVGTKARTPDEKRAERRQALRSALLAIALCFEVDEDEDYDAYYRLFCAYVMVEGLNAWLASIAADPPDPRLDRIALVRAAPVRSAASDLARAAQEVSAISQALAKTTNRFDAAVAAGRTNFAALHRAVIKTYYGRLTAALARRSAAERRFASALRGHRTRLAESRVRAAKRRLFSLGGAPRTAIAAVRAEGFGTAQIAGALRGLAGLVPNRPIDLRRALTRAPGTQAFQVSWGSLSPSDVALIAEALRGQGSFSRDAEAEIKTRLAALARICDAGSRTAAVRALIGYVNGLPRRPGRALLVTAATGLRASRC